MSTRIAAKDEKRILFRGLIEPSRRDPLVGKVVIGSETPEVNEENDAAIMEIGVVETADLRIGIESVKETNIAGNEISYRIILENRGPSNAANVTLRDNAPERLSRPEISVDGGSTWLPWPGMWNFDVIPSGEIRELLLQGRIDPAASGLLTYEARIDSSATPDPDKENDRFVVGTQIEARADLSLELLHAPDAVLAGDETEYRLRVSNLGPSDAMGVGLSYEPLGLLERAKASVDGGDNWEPSSGTLELGSLDAGGRSRNRHTGQGALPDQGRAFGSVPGIGGYVGLHRIQRQGGLFVHPRVGGGGRQCTALDAHGTLRRRRAGFLYHNRE